jgi:threonine synthase
MDYVSTRGGAARAGFEDALLAGLAPDGGLYMPQRWPRLSPAAVAAFKGKPYAEVAAQVMSLFAGEAFSHAELGDMAEAAYGVFDHPDIAPLRRIGEEDWILELFHGPTLAFKDFAMQILARMFAAALERRNERRVIIVATSGDTGAAAIEALKTCPRVDIVVLHPKGRVSDVQRRMMTCVDAPNVLNIAVEGSFDDCQAIVKALFADSAFVKDVGLSGVNSINWARLAAQTVYYFTAAAAVAAEGEGVSFAVPTGNFGDVFAGFAAKKMGLPVARLAVATNANDILHRALAAGDYSTAEVVSTSAPAMDIQIASNFERLLFETLDRDAAELRQCMETFAAKRALRLSENMRLRIAADFVSCAVSEAETLAEMKRHYEETGDLIDPHTAVGRHAARVLREAGALSGKIVTLAAAHPAKFPEAVTRATGVRPALPAVHADLYKRQEFFETAPAQTAAVKALIVKRLSMKERS